MLLAMAESCMLTEQRVAYCQDLNFSSVVNYSWFGYQFHAAGWYVWVPLCCQLSFIHMSSLLWPNADFTTIGLHIVKAKETFILQYSRSISDDPSCCNCERSTMSYLCSVPSICCWWLFSVKCTIQCNLTVKYFYSRTTFMRYFRDISGDSNYF